MMYMRALMERLSIWQQLIDEWEGECVDIQVIPLREYAEAK